MSAAPKGGPRHGSGRPRQAPRDTVLVSLRLAPDVAEAIGRVPRERRARYVERLVREDCARDTAGKVRHDAEEV